ncbi:MAG TPA: type II secretion system protein, partial [Planctomycetota bacterium]|nr:type II secretion system protein [Planctomycetota bacterium]
GGYRPGARHCPPVSPRSEAGFTLIEVLAVLAIIVVIAGLLVPTLYRTTCTGAYRVQCSSNLNQIYNLARGFADKKGNGACPIASTREPRAHESLHVLLEANPDIPSRLFVCVESVATDAVADESGKYTLGPNNLAYSWVSSRTEATAPGKAISSDKYIEGYRDKQGQDHWGHKGGMNVLMSDHSVTFTEEADLPEDTRLPAGLTR